MSAFDLHFAQNNIHNRWHQRFEDNIEQITFYHQDPSCPLCHPPAPNNNRQFEHFWIWYSIEYPATTYTYRSQLAFDAVRSANGQPELTEAITTLLLSIRYSHSPKPFNELRNDVYYAAVITDRFQRDPLEELYQVSEAFIAPEESSDEESDISDHTPPDPPPLWIHNPVQVHPGLLFEEEDLYLDHLFVEPPPHHHQHHQPQQQQQHHHLNIMAANQADIQALTQAVRNLTGQFGAPNWGNVQNAVNNLNATVTANNNVLQNRGQVVPIPTFSGGNQDPVTWLNEFNLACAANGWNVARKLQVVPAYLKGPAATWYQIAAGAPINAWAVAANNNNFEHAFLTRFRTPAMVEMWDTELEQRQQQPGESVDEYASSIQELYQRVNDAVFAYPDNLQARKFISGLRPELFMAVKPFGDQTLAAAINRAKGCELTLKSGRAKLLNYANQSNSEVVELTKLVAALTNQVAELGKKIPSPGPRYPRNENRIENRGVNPTSPAVGATTSTRPPIVCFTCGEPGHISKRCPNVAATTTESNKITEVATGNTPSSNQNLIQELLRQLGASANTSSSPLN